MHEHSKFSPFMALNFNLEAHLNLAAMMAYSPSKQCSICKKKHNLPTHVAFVGLVKAYDMANHDLLLKILAKYGAPPKFISAVERMYQDLAVVLY